MYEGHLANTPNLRIGHAQDDEAQTGVTAVLFEGDGAICGVAVRGASPGTRELALLDPQNRVERVNAIALCGGSAYGLNAAGGVMRYLEEAGIGYNAGVARVPIVPAAVIFDLACGRADIRPDEAMGYRAAACAAVDTRQGRIGAGRGATIGKGIPDGQPAKGGIGAASIELPGGVVVGAMLVVNAVGDAVDPWTGECLACATMDGRPMRLEDAFEAMMPNMNPLPGANTTIGIVATNAALTKASANRLASIAHDGIALAIRPAHTQFDGDTLFAASTDALPCDPMLLEMAAVRAVARAACNAAIAARKGIVP